MNRNQVESDFGCGSVLREFSNYGLLTSFVRFLYVSFGAWAAYHSFHEGPYFGARIVDYILIIFTLWRFYRQGDSLLYLCQKGIVMRRRPRGVAEQMTAYWDDSDFYYFATYDQIIGFSDSWEFAHVSVLTEGGVLMVPVDLQYLRRKDKKYIEDFIERQKNIPTNGSSLM